MDEEKLRAQLAELLKLPVGQRLTYHLWDRDSGEIRETTDTLEWSNWFEDIDNRRVALDEIEDIVVSTVALGLDHAWSGGPPLIFETLVFRQDPEERTVFGTPVTHEMEMQRFSTVEDALDFHDAMVRQMEAHRRLIETEEE